MNASSLQSGNPAVRVGCCIPVLSAGPGGWGADNPGALESLGLDYVELPLAQTADLEESAYLGLAPSLAACGLRCEAFNYFFPKRIRLTGPEADHSAALVYSAAALDRAARLGAKIAVFGSAAARNVPEGFSMEEAWRQLVAFTSLLGDLARERGMMIAMEHLNRGESNILTSLRETETFVLEVDHPAVGLLCDYYHVAMEGEILPDANSGISLIHAHIAAPEGRLYPRSGDGCDYRPFFDFLKALNYEGRISLEARSEDPARDIPGALSFIRSFFGC